MCGETEREVSGPVDICLGRCSYCLLCGDTEHEGRTENATDQCRSSGAPADGVWLRAWRPGYTQCQQEASRDSIAWMCCW